MIKTNTKVFLEIPDESEKRILHPGKVVRVSETIITAEFVEEDLHLEKGMDFFLYFNIKQKFTKLPARIKSVNRTEPSIMVALETTGDPVSANTRQFFRVFALGGDLTADFGPEKNCVVVDVSAKGFAVHATKRHKVGTRVEAVVHHEGKAFSGTVAVMNVRKGGKGQFRYGVLCLDDAESGGSLKNGLPKVSLAIQRKELARLSGLD
ncbi:MAG: PilZ domain-containing protein [Deltaproteobacteria bacterium]|nr:MAG: PilZ domain-containing protein [Deltaproteobacteria bacterium]